MRSGTSCFNPTVFKKTFFRFWPIWAANLAVWVLVLPVYLLSRMQESAGYVCQIARSLLAEPNIILVVVGAVPLCLAAAMAVCSHLNKSRSANFYGALPLRREGLFLSTWLAGLAMLLGPNLVTVALTALVEAAAGAVYWEQLLGLLAFVSVCELFFFSLGVLCGMFTGQTWMIPVFYTAANVLALAVKTAVEAMTSTFYYGYLSNTGGFWDQLVTWLTPAVKFTNFWVMCGKLPGEVDFGPENGAILAVYGAAALLFTVAALLLCRRRRLECAGDAVSMAWTRPVFRFGGALGFGAVCGLLTDLILNLEADGVIVAVTFWTLVGGFLAQMLLDKRFRVFGKWKSCLVPGLLVLAALLGMRFDVTGFVDRIPDPVEVEYVAVSSLDSAPYDDAGWWRDVEVRQPEQIANVVRLHQEAIQGKDGQNGYWWEESMKIVYHLKNGKTLSRRYAMDFSDPSWDLDKHPDNDAAVAYWSLLGDRELTRQRYGFDEMQTLLDQGGRLVYTTSPMAGTLDESDVFWSGDKALTLWETVKQDFAEGAFGGHGWKADEDSPSVYLLTFLVFTGDEDPGFIGKHWEKKITILLPGTAERTLALLGENDK